mmetsp:Transcript_29935/g.64122  ORF Transcript_29935/g.64122 Transcript_29935/m.64122 type:complete len:109 (+) Transcript_29935:922-1248(+)
MLSWCHRHCIISCFETSTPQLLNAVPLMQDACYGDSGGPLVIPGNDATEDVQIGVVSWGIGCSGDYPGVFSRVSTAYDWIREQVCKESIDPPASFSCKGKKGKGKKER